MTQRVHDKARYLSGTVKMSFSLFGEDRILYKLLQGKLQSGTPGRYVDVGCGEPFRNSNTALLYLHGWQGIAVDPVDSHVRAFAEQRPEDVVVQAVIGRRDGPVRLVVDTATAERSRALDPGEVAPDGARVLESPTMSLAALLESRLPDPAAGIDLLDIDAEGMDLEVLMSNDWTRFRPRVVAVEDHGFAAGDPASPIHRHLSGLGYRLHSSTFLTRIYTDRGFTR